jgi:hypothetical protein
LNASEIVRGKIATVIAEGSGGRFVLQWGDELFVPAGFPDQAQATDDRLVLDRENGFVLLLDRKKSACVALTTEEFSALCS